ncbi:MAG: hypothetical protein NTU95_04435 [Methanothrix sp.]|nr:hypothetical protein [Methanothrix sp.]
MGDFLEEAGKEWKKKSGGDKNEAGEQPTLEPIPMVGEDVAEKEVITSDIPKSQPRYGVRAPPASAFCIAASIRRAFCYAVSRVV